jgi:hypothetical protein
MMAARLLERLLGPRVLRGIHADELRRLGAYALSRCNG